MKRTALFMGAIGLVASSAFAQEPSAQLRRFDRMIGNWEGSGEVFIGPGAEGMPWTSVSTVQRILDGHFFQEDLRIEFGEGMPPMIWRSIYGWDSEHDRPIIHSVSNDGASMAGNMHWQDENTTISVSHGVEEGTPYAERATTHWGDGVARFVIERALGDGPFFEHVKGSFKKSEKTVSATSVENSIAFGEPNSNLRIFDKMMGTYRGKGQIVLTPGADRTDLDYEISINWMLGGMAMIVHAPATEVIPEFWGYGYWDVENANIGYFRVDSRGRYKSFQGLPTGDGKIVYASTYSVDGMLGTERLVLTLADDGTLAGVRVELLLGANAPIEVVAARYELTGGAPAGTIQASFKAGSCCDRAVKAGKTCTHPCCVEAAKLGQVCSKCN